MTTSTNLDADAVLVVDDDAVSRILCESVVRNAGGRAFLAETGAQARGLFGEREFACAVIDLHLPDGTGLDLLRPIKDRSPRTEVIVVTAHADVDSAIEALRLGAFDYILKPFDVRAFTHRLQSALERRRVMAENTRMQTLLVQAERMASVGTLASGMAHEINNPLAYVIANLGFVAEEVPRLRAEFLAGGTPLDAATIEDFSARLVEIEETVRDAREGSDRVRTIVKDLRTFSRGDDEKIGPVDLERVLETAIHMSWNEIRHRCRLERAFAGVPPVDGNESRLAQVFVNLLLNAAQAIPEGQVERNLIRVVTRTDGPEYVAVEVHDSGTGIAPEIMGRLFEPFFTTKPVGVGTGLGLALCHGVVTGLGGKIEVDSERGKGTCFRVLLPALKEEEAQEVTVPAVAAGAKKGRVLVVDDEPMIGASVRRVLSPEHEVLAVPRAREALAKLSAGERFDLILCDLMMPEMSGMDLHAELVRVAPDQARRMVFLTGGAFTPRARAFLEQVANARLEKPFDAENLRGLVRDLVR